jgi:hypothetical protein
VMAFCEIICAEVETQNVFHRKSASQRSSTRF